MCTWSNKYDWQGEYKTSCGKEISNIGYHLKTFSHCPFCGDELIIEKNEKHEQCSGEFQKCYIPVSKEAYYALMDLGYLPERDSDWYECTGSGFDTYKVMYNNTFCMFESGDLWTYSDYKELEIIDGQIKIKN